MIKSHMGSVKVEGKRSMVLTDLAVAVQAIMEALVENGSNVEKKIRELVEEIMKSRAEEDVDRKRR